MDNKILVKFENIEWTQIDKNNNHQMEELTSDWVAYMREIYVNDSEVIACTNGEIESWLTGRVNIQGQRDTMHFELIIVDEIIVGFIMYAVDLGGIKDIIDAGYGYIMEFYVKPDFRRKKIGYKTFLHIKEILKGHGVNKIYLTPDSKSGIPFWNSMNFKNCGKVDPDNLMPIYVSEINN